MDSGNPPNALALSPKGSRKPPKRSGEAPSEMGITAIWMGVSPMELGLSAIWMATVPAWIGRRPSGWGGPLPAGDDPHLDRGGPHLEGGKAPSPGRLVEAGGGIGAGRIQISRDLSDEGGGDLLFPDGLLEEDQGGAGLAQWPRADLA